MVVLLLLLVSEVLSLKMMMSPLELLVSLVLLLLDCIDICNQCHVYDPV